MAWSETVNLRNHLSNTLHTLVTDLPMTDISPAILGVCAFRTRIKDSQATFEALTEFYESHGWRYIGPTIRYNKGPFGGHQFMRPDDPVMWAYISFFSNSIKTIRIDVYSHSPEFSFL